jgi:Domain of unknown function (DUF4132)
LEVRWEGAGGKSRASVPAAVKKDHAGALKELQAAHKQIKAILPAQRQRLERLFLADRTWTVERWQRDYLDHPIVGGLARRLIWTIADIPVLPEGDEFNDVAGRDVKVRATDPVRLWHPIGRAAADVLAWRERLEALGITQPFKQAHREVYVVTDAERNTASYSNRFAAHILRQHQFAALAHDRGWAYRLMGRFDSHNTPWIQLPRWNAQVEFWVEACEQGGYSESGIDLYISTDQVRFYELSPLAQIDLEHVPALLFSEMMRDVDLFVGVSSVGNDPAWQDGGPGGHFQAYWTQISFGELTESAKTRHAVLERLLPRLTKLQDRWTLTARFLVIRGDLRTYKIHLGSGNILMEPNDQYLCIVPGRPTAIPSLHDTVFLPFEGDNTLSIILSKAFLLAADKTIKDPTITRQLGLH